MSRHKNSGYIVQTHDGKTGRTYHSKGTIKDKVPVYLEVKPFEYEKAGTLYAPDKIKIIGMID